MTINVLVVIVGLGLTCSLGCLYPYFYIQGGQDYKKSNRVGYNMIPIRIISLVFYFTYIFKDIIIYILENIP
jgi:hypothetical protein